MSSPSRPEWQRAALRRAILPFVILVIGCVLVLATHRFWSYVGWAVIGTALVIAISLVFLEIGYSEDREREREAGRGRRPGPG
jgi:Flp pilus assembly protein TadB